MNNLPEWIVFAVGSAFFAALTAILGKLGVAGVNSNVATLIRTTVILIVITGIIAFRNEWQKPSSITAKSWIFLVLSGIATGLSWLCYYRALQIGPVTKVAPIDKLSVAFAIVLGIGVLGETLTWPVALGGSLIVAGSIIMIAF